MTATPPEIEEFSKGTSEALFGLVRALMGRGILSPSFLIEHMAEIRAGQESMGSPAPLNRRATAEGIATIAENTIKARAALPEPQHGANTEIALSLGVYDVVIAITVALVEIGAIDRALILKVLNVALETTERNGGFLADDRARPAREAIAALTEKPRAAPTFGVIEGGLGSGAGSSGGVTNRRARGATPSPRPPPLPDQP